MRPTGRPRPRPCRRMRPARARERNPAAAGSASRRGPVHHLSRYRYAARWWLTTERTGARERLAPTTWVTTAPGSYRTPVAARGDLPTDVDVLEEHEVPLVPAADPVERLAAEPQRGTRHPVDVARPARCRHRSVGSARVNRFRGATPPSSACPTATPAPGAVRADGYVDAVGVHDVRADDGDVGRGRERVEHGPADPGAIRVSGLHMSTNGARVAATPRLAARA